MNEEGGLVGKRRRVHVVVDWKERRTVKNMEEESMQRVR